MSDLPPRLIAGRWVIPELIVQGDQLVVQVALSMDPAAGVKGSSIVVGVWSGPTRLKQVSAPKRDAPLPFAATGAAYAQASFVFDNPNGLVPTRLIITVDGQSAEFDTAAVVPSVPESTAPVVSLRISLLRPDDLLNLTVDAVNLRLDAEDPDHPVLVHADEAKQALVIVHFPPQTIVEQAFFEAGGPKPKDRPPDGVRPSDPDPTSGPATAMPGPPGSAAARIGGPTRLVFRVPDGVSIPYSIEGLLDWSQLEPVVSPIAEVAADGEPPVAALAIRPPEPTETTLQLPYRIHLSPSHLASWDHSARIVAHRGRSELWHTRLALPNAEGRIQRSDDGHTVPLRAIWSPDYRPGDLPSPGDLSPLGVLAAMSGSDRDQIVILTSSFRGYAADEYTQYVPQPIQASLVMLSPLGGWLRSFGAWNPPYRIVPPRRAGRVRIEDVLRAEALPRIDAIGASPEVGIELNAPVIEDAPPEAVEPLRPGDEIEAVDREGVGGVESVDAAPGRFAVPVDREGVGAVESVEAAPGRFAVPVDQIALPGLGFRIPLFELDGQLDLSQWAHVAAQGRDHYVRIVYEGRLKELGHRAALVKVTERRFEPTWSGPVAYLRQFMYIVVREPEKDYGREGLQQDGRGMPLRRVRITTLVTPHIDYPYPSQTNKTNDPAKKPDYNPASITDRSFWVMSGEVDFPFHAVGVDVAGHTVDFTKTLVFVPNSENNLAAVHKAFNAVENRQRRAATVPGQKVTFAPAEAANENTAFVAQSLNFENEGATRETFFKPRLFKADVRIPAVEHLAGADAPTTIRLSQRYLDHGFADAGNATGAFAEVVKQDAGGDLAPAGLSVGFAASQAGGFATPALDIAVLTRGAGPLGGTPTQALTNDFDPSQVFKKGIATLFGVFDLADLLPQGSVDGQAPKMHIRHEGAAVITALDWMSPVKSPVGLSGVVEFLHDPDAVAATMLEVHALVRKDPAGATPDSQSLTGQLNDFSIRFFEVLQLNFHMFTFASKTGRKTDVNVALRSDNPILFQGDLAFVEGLRQLIPPGVFGDGVSIDMLQSPLGVRAGLAIGLPPASVGVFSLKNIAFSAGLTIPFLDGKPVVEFGFARRDNPFLLAVAFLGGGGFFHIDLDTEGIRMLEAAFEFGAVAALDIGVASGEVHIMAGIYFKMEKKVQPGGKELAVSSLTGYLRCGGSLSVLGLVTISVEFYLCFAYVVDLEKATGRATLTVEIEIACFSKSIELTVERSFGSKGGDPTFGQLMDTPQLWADYAHAFA
jgi:hypothetical protein